MNFVCFRSFSYVWTLLISYVFVCFVFHAHASFISHCSTASHAHFSQFSDNCWTWTLLNLSRTSHTVVMIGICLNITFAAWHLHIMVTHVFTLLHVFLGSIASRRPWPLWMSCHELGRNAVVRIARCSALINFLTLHNFGEHCFSWPLLCRCDIGHHSAAAACQIPTALCEP